jgi:two-component system, OmpR family, heavy metal sensor histidine kinase CusS
MKHYSLRWKLVTWAALFALSASIICLWTTWILVRAQEVQALDRRLVTDARELFRDIENFQGTNKRRDVTERFVPLALRDRLVEVRGPDGEILYMSPNLSEPVLKDEIETFHTRQIGGRTVRIGVFHDEELTLHVGADLKDIEQLGWEIARSLVIVIPLVLLLIAGGSWWLGSIALTPIENIRRAAERITAERLDERILSHGAADEIGRLIDVLNATFERLQGSFEQAARFSADASHQLKTPIAVLRAGIEEILAQPNLSDEHRERVADLLEQTRRLSSVAENLLLLSRADTGRLALRTTQFDLGKLLEGSLEDARILGARSSLQIEANIPEPLPMNGDREMISLTVQNLVENAVKYNRPGGKIRVSAEKHDHVVEISVGNNGPGIPPERTPHVFERFYRARGSEQTPGHGLGLSIARELARAHGGDLTIAKSQPDWTEFCLRLSMSSVHLETEKWPPITGK